VKGRETVGERKGKR